MLLIIVIYTADVQLHFTSSHLPIWKSHTVLAERSDNFFFFFFLVKCCFNFYTSYNPKPS